jgi:hypothetical protein
MLAIMIIFYYASWFVLEGYYFRIQISVYLLDMALKMYVIAIFVTVILWITFMYNIEYIGKSIICLPYQPTDFMQSAFCYINSAK